jgi:hypothetical protein
LCQDASQTHHPLLLLLPRHIEAVAAAQGRCSTLCPSCLLLLLLLWL